MLSRFDRMMDPGAGVRVCALVVGHSFGHRFASYIAMAGRSQNLAPEGMDGSYESISGGMVTSIEQEISA